MAKLLGGGQVGASKNATLPATWWRAEQDRALLDHTAASGLHLTDAKWEELYSSNPLYATAAPSPATTAAAAAAAA